MVSREALMGWCRPYIGLVNPGAFIPLAEEIGHIVEIGEWVLETACRQNREWQLASAERLTVAVNLSARQLWHPYLAEIVRAILKPAQLEPQFLDIELTESTLMENLETGAKTLEQVSKRGVRMSLHDFGTWYFR